MNSLDLFLEVTFRFEVRPALPFRPLFIPDRNDGRLQPRPPIHQLPEWSLTIISGAHLCLLPWAFGGMHTLCQEASLVISVSALIIALMGVLRWREDINVLSSVTGSSRDNTGGAIWCG